MVGRKSTERGIEARRFHYRSGKDAKNRASQLDHCSAGGPDCDFCRADHRLHQAVMRKHSAMGVTGFVLACVWIVVSLANAERALAAPQSGGSEQQDTEKQTSGEA